MAFPYLRPFSPGSQNRPRAVLTNDWIGSRSRRPWGGLDVQDLVGLSLGCSTPPTSRGERSEAAASPPRLAPLRRGSCNRCVCGYPSRSVPSRPVPFRPVPSRSRPVRTREPAKPAHRLSNTTWFGRSGRANRWICGFPGPLGRESDYPTLPRFRGDGTDGTERDGTDGTDGTERDGTSTDAGCREAGSRLHSRLTAGFLQEQGGTQPAYSRLTSGFRIQPAYIRLTAG